MMHLVSFNKDNSSKHLVAELKAMLFLVPFVLIQTIIFILFPISSISYGTSNILIKYDHSTIVASEIN